MGFSVQSDVQFEEPERSEEHGTIQVCGGGGREKSSLYGRGLYVWSHTFGLDKRKITGLSERRPGDWR